MRWVAIFGVAGVVVACSSSGTEAEAPASTVAAVASSTTTSMSPVAPSTSVQPDSAPVDPLAGVDALLLPAELPDGWETASIVVFPRFDRRAAEVASLVAWREGTDFDAGGVSITVGRFAEPTELVPSQIFEFVESSPLEVDGLAEVAQVARDGSFVSLVGRLDERTQVELFGDVPAEVLAMLAAGVVVDETTEDLAVVLEVEGWSSTPARLDGSHYHVGLTGPGGAFEVFVNTGAVREALYVGGTELTERLIGTRGEGYRRVQRIESEGLEFPFIEWWVPGAALETGDRLDVEMVVAILDSFTEVPASEWDERLATVSVSALDPGPPSGSEGPEPVPDTEVEQLDAVVLERIMAAVESEVGRSFGADIEVSIVDGAVLRASVPDGTFVAESTWEVLTALGLVDADDDRASAEAVRIDQLRGVCCPVTVIDTGDAAFTEIVVAHELTHLLDAEIVAPGVAMPELVDPVRALLEGNAHRVAFAYADVLAAEGASVPDPPAVFPPGVDPRLPPAVRELLEFPYDEGLAFARELVELGGTDAIDAAFASPPLSSAQVLNLDAYLAGEAAEVVPPPEVTDGDPGASGTLGAFVLRLLLAEELPGDEADELSLAWAGDAYRLSDGPSGACIDLRLSLENETAAGEVADAIDARAEFVERSGRQVDARLCSR